MLNTIFYRIILDENALSCSSNMALKRLMKTLGIRAHGHATNIRKLDGDFNFFF